MKYAFYWLLRAFIALIQCLPLALVSRLGRAGAWIGWCFDARHRNVAIGNLTHAFGAEKSAAEIRAIARENYLRLGANYFCLIKIASMPAAKLRPHLEWTGLDRLTQADGRSGILAIGHFGNFELFERLPEVRPDLEIVSTYRALRQPMFNDLMQGFRTRYGVRFFERRESSEALKQELAGGKSWLILLADQHAGPKGVWLPFMGRECSCSVSPALFALRYKRPLMTAICFQTGPCHWRIEIGEPIPLFEAGRRSSVETVTRHLNAAYEAAIRRDPRNWFWVHRRWKAASEFQDEDNARHGGASSGEAA